MWTDGQTDAPQLADFSQNFFYHSTPLRLRAFGGNFPTSRLREDPPTNGKLTSALSAPVKVDHFKAEQYFRCVGEQPSLLLKFQSMLSNQATCELQFFLGSSAGTPELKIFPILGPILQKQITSVKRIKLIDLKRAVDFKRSIQRRISKARSKIEHFWKLSHLSKWNIRYTIGLQRLKHGLNWFVRARFICAHAAVVCAWACYIKKMIMSSNE